MEENKDNPKQPFLTVETGERTSQILARSKSDSQGIGNGGNINQSEFTKNSNVSQSERTGENAPVSAPPEMTIIEELDHSEIIET